MVKSYYMNGFLKEVHIMSKKRGSIARKICGLVLAMVVFSPSTKVINSRIACNFVILLTPIKQKQKVCVKNNVSKVH